MASGSSSYSPCMHFCFQQLHGLLLPLLACLGQVTKEGDEQSLNTLASTRPHHTSHSEFQLGSGLNPNPDNGQCINDDHWNESNQEARYHWKWGSISSMLQTFSSHAPVPFMQGRGWQRSAEGERGLKETLQFWCFTTTPLHLSIHTEQCMGIGGYNKDDMSL
jgi:hypothetical protein